ncbi:mandelate racemase/muconate lactonizing enzyme family protein [Pseudobacillus badius]|uniref:mandelate racemase/muconate lactonizing enzyme family protein n=1 Tax=Bacillus badius TaxID=1455 RepID=UPI0007B3E9AC|nr:dipeptide epimerase [Bacillus badius]KZR60057.1 dipeptide epimerase [Bacillus badius]
MKIHSIEVFAVRLPLISPFIVSYHTYHDMPSIIVKIETDNGLIGYGEGTPDEHVTGETWEGTYAVLGQTLGPAVIGIDPFQIEKIHEKMNRTIFGATTAKAAIDIACYDLMGKASGQPVYNLLGGRYHESLEIPKVISILSPDEMAEEAIQAMKDGYKTLKLKVGTDINLDSERIRQVRNAVGPEVPIKVDANQGWENSADALRVLGEVVDCKIDWIEQPVAAADIDGLKEIKQKTMIPVMIDEGLHGDKEMHEIIVKRAADKINIKLMKCGGLYPAAHLVHQAQMAGLTCQVGSMVESAIASAAGLHLSIAKKKIQSNELVGPLMFSKNVAEMDYKIPYVHLSDKPGLGIEINETILNELTSRCVKVEKQ